MLETIKEVIQKEYGNTLGIVAYHTRLPHLRLHIIGMAAFSISHSHEFVASLRKFDGETL